MLQARIKQFAIATFAATGLALTTPALAASNCKGLEKGRCASSSSCTWVDSYTTKKGNKVAAYCRAKGGKSTSAKSSSSKKSANKSGSTKKTSASGAKKEKSGASKTASH